MQMILNKDTVLPAVYGGTFLGGGGGGWIEEGIEVANMAVSIGTPRLVNISELPSDSYVCTASLVGAPANPDRCVKPIDYITALKNLTNNIGVNLSGIISNENGAVATVNGWIQSAVLGIPVVDAPSNGRAHPTGVMGSMMLNKEKNYISYQSAVGGNKSKGKYIEAFAKGSINTTSAVIRQVSEHAGGFVAVARNPVPASYVQKNGAVGAIKQAIKIGEAFLNKSKDGAMAMIEAIVNEAQGEIIDKGILSSKILKMSKGFDVGELRIKNESREYIIDVWNEYMILESKGERLATFPDLIMLMDMDTGRPLISAEASISNQVCIVKVPRNKLILGSGMRDKDNMIEVEEILNKDICKYCVDLF
jgi:DUF917 family protein